MLSVSLRELPSFEIGFEEGVEEGIEKGIEKTIINAYKEGVDVNTISNFSQLSIEQVKNILQKQKLL